MVIKIEVRYKGRKSFFRKMTKLFGIHKHMTTWNKILAKFARRKVIKAMKRAGIKKRTGRLFASVRPDNITKDGFDIVSSPIAALLEKGREESWLIEPTKAHGLLVFDKPGEGTKFIFGPVTHPPMAPRPWSEKAASDISDFLGRKYIINIRNLVK